MFTFETLNSNFITYASSNTFIVAIMFFFFFIILSYSFEKYVMLLPPYKRTCKNVEFSSFFFSAFLQYSAISLFSQIFHGLFFLGRFVYRVDFFQWVFIFIFFPRGEGWGIFSRYFSSITTYFPRHCARYEPKLIYELLRENNRVTPAAAF